MRISRPLALVVALVALALSGAAVADPGEGSGEEATEHSSALLATSASAPRASSKSLEQIGYANPGTGMNGDVYAYQGHAYLGSWIGRGCLSKGVRVYDLGNPRSPELVSTFADAASEPELARTWTEKVIVKHVNTTTFTGDLAVVSVQTCSRLDPTAFRGFALYDVTDPADPTRLALYSTEPGVNGGSHEIWLEAAGGRAYVYTAIPNSELRTNQAKADFRIIDVSDPASPVEVAQWGAWKELGIHPNAGQGGFSRNFVHSVIVNDQATRAYLSYWDLGTVILDVSDPTEPTYLGRTSFRPDEEGDAHSAAIARGGDLLIETHETDAGLPTYYDISDPANPVRLAEFVPDGYQFDTVHDPKIHGSLSYYSWYTLGIVVADSSRPDKPRFVAQFVPESDYLNPDNFFCSEACPVVWGVFVDRNYVLASDMNSGLYVLKLK